MKVAVVILAAGQGTRMRSALPKVLHPLAGKPLIQYSLGIAGGVSEETPVVVVGHGADRVREAVGDQAHFAVQDRQLGTADAVRAAESALAGKSDYVVVISADMPLLTVETLRSLIERQSQNPGPITMTIVVNGDSHGFGRVVREADGSVAAIVEEAQATPEQLAIRELNAGVYCFRADWLWAALKRVKLSPKGEYYLTDLVALAREDGMPVQAFTVADPGEAMGINTRIHLAEAEQIMRRRINSDWMLSGVTMIDPERTYIEPGVVIGQDTTLWPDTYLRGETSVGTGCEIGPGVVLINVRAGDHCRVVQSWAENAVIRDGEVVGPFANFGKGNLRPFYKKEQQLG